MSEKVIPISDLRVLIEYANGDHKVIPVDTNQCPSFSSLIIHLHKDYNYDPGKDKLFSLKLM